VFDRPDERQIVFERMDWSHPQRRGYYEKNKAFIAVGAGAARRDADRGSDPGDVQRRRRADARPRRALRALPVAGPVLGRDHRVRARDFSLVDVNGAGCSKGTTLARWVGARLDRARSIMAVGDNLNDVEMLDFAGVAVVMGNAADGLKSRGYRLTGSNDEAGLASAISAYVANGNERGEIVGKRRLETQRAVLDWMREREAMGVQRLPRKRDRGLGGGRSHVALLADQRMSVQPRLHADLILPARHQRDLNQRRAGQTSDHAIPLIASLRADHARRPASG
jgi:hypothetical protein